MFEGKKVFDVTKSIINGMTVWPGDGGVEIKRTVSISEGALVNVSRVTMGVHTGTHMDAPLHFIDGAKDMTQVPVNRFFGRVLVVESDKLEIDETIFENQPIDDVQAVFFKTSSSGLNEFSPFQEKYPAITESCADYLVSHGIKAVGIDYLSIECCNDDSFSVHHTLLGNEIVIIENLALQAIEPGIYDYICLPLMIGGSDGSPVRALLFK